MKPIVHALMMLLVLPLAFGQVPDLRLYVTDTAGVLSPEGKVALEQTLRDLEKETSGVQFVIYIENKYPKEFSLEEYTLKIAEENGVGKEENDNGILFYLAVDDREYRWEVGYGVESTLSASLLGRISREQVVPSFKEGNYEQGIIDAVDTVQSILLGSSDADIAGSNAAKQSLSTTKGMVIAIVVIIIIFIVIGLIVSSKQPLKKRSSWKDDIYTGAAAGLFLPRWGGGSGGFGGGGFGGFSGGGGSFGGGGFSGKF